MEQRVRRCMVLLALAAASIGRPRVAEAQRLVLSVGDSSVASSAILVHDVAAAVTESARTGQLRRPAVFSADGRFALMTRALGGAAELSELYDVVSRTTTLLPFRARVAHPRALAVFGTASGAVQRLDTSGVQTFPVCGGFNEVVSDLDLTVDGTRLLALCSTTLTMSHSHYVVVLRTATGEVERATSRFAGAAYSLTASADGAAALVLVRLSTAAIEAAQVDTVADRRQTVFVDAPFSSLAADGGCDRIGVTPARDVAALHCEWTLGASHTSRTELLRLDSWQRRDVLSAPGAFAMAFSPDGTHAIVASDQPPSVQFLDVANDVIERQVALPVLNLCAAFPPLAPAGLTAAVASRDVRLDWGLPPPSPAATGYLLEVGLASGQTWVTIPVGPAAALTVTNAPPGRYFLRLRAINYSGLSAPSVELEVHVP